MVRPKKSTDNQLIQEPTDTILDKWFLLGAIIRDERSRKIHSQVAWPILEAYYSKYGNGRASVRYLERASGLTKGSVSTATADLVAWGYFSRVMGAGKLATSYAPNWELASVLRRQDVLRPPDASSVLRPPDASVPQSPDANGFGVPPSPDESLLRVPLTSGDKEEEQTAPLPGGLAAPVGVDFVPKKMKIINAGIEEDGTDGQWVFIELQGDDGSQGHDAFELECGTIIAEVLDGSPTTRFHHFLRAANLMGHPESMDDFKGCSVWVGGVSGNYTFHTEDSAAEEPGDVEADVPDWWRRAAFEPTIKREATFTPRPDAPWRRQAPTRTSVAL